MNADASAQLLYFPRCFEMQACHGGGYTPDRVLPWLHMITRFSTKPYNVFLAFYTIDEVYRLEEKKTKEDLEPEHPAKRSRFFG